MIAAGKVYPRRRVRERIPLISFGKAIFTDVSDHYFWHACQPLDLGFRGGSIR
jgi:hypothetical protein